MKKLLDAETRRIAKRSKLRGEKLERSVAFSNLGSGPLELIAGMPLSGNVLILLPADDEDVRKGLRELFHSKRDKTIRKIRDLASGADFWQWLLSNSGRDDPIGDLAHDISEDRNYPHDIKHYQEAFAYLSRIGACDGALRSLAEAWTEYSEKYPDRIIPAAWCGRCERQISDLQDGVLALDEYGELEVLHSECLNEQPEQEVFLDEILINDPTFEKLTDFFEGTKVDSTVAAEIETRFRLWGFNACPRRTSSKVYFIQVGTSGPIKIGFTRGSGQRRLASLQTGQAEPLRLLAELDGDRSTEADLHKRFGIHRRADEWFEPHPDLVQFIAVLKSD